MAVTTATALRNVLADAVNNYINTTGAGTAQTVLLESAVTVVAFDEENPAFGAASGGTITLEGTPIAAAAVAAGEVDNAILTDRNGDMALACSVTATGMGGDITVNNVNIANGQVCSLESLTYTAPA